MKNIIFKPANELVEDIKSKKISVVDTVKAFLAQIKKHNPKLNAIIDIRRDFYYRFIWHPIVVIPIGEKKNGMPVGVQIHSRKWTDYKLLQIAKYLEGFTDGFKIPTSVIK